LSFLQKAHHPRRGEGAKGTGHDDGRQKYRAQGIGNSGKFSKVPGGDKPTKRVNLRYRCSECKKAHNRKGFKVSKFDLVEG
jgi:large subunit ribosomal protein L44e